MIPSQVTDVMNTNSIQQVILPTLETPIRNEKYCPPLPFRPWDRRRLLLTHFIDDDMTTTTSFSRNVVPSDTSYLPTLPGRQIVHGRFADVSVDLVSLKFPSLDDDTFSDCFTDTTDRQKDGAVQTVSASFRLSKRRKGIHGGHLADNDSSVRPTVVPPNLEDVMENGVALDARVNLLRFFNDATKNNGW